MNGLDLCAGFRGRSGAAGDGTAGFEDKMAFHYGMGLHGGDAGEDFEDLVMAFGGDLAKEEKLVHNGLGKN